MHVSFRVCYLLVLVTGRTTCVTGLNLAMGEPTASLPGLDYDLSFDDCQTLLDGEAEQHAVNLTDSPTQKEAAPQPQERHDSMDSCMIHDPGIAKPRTRKPRSQEQARAAQQRFRIRQKVA